MQKFEESHCESGKSSQWLHQFLPLHKFSGEKQWNERMKQ